MAQELKRFLPEEEEALFKAYDILSAAGFDIRIEDGGMAVWYSECDIELDMEEGIVLVPEDYLPEYYDRQQELSKDF